MVVVFFWCVFMFGPRDIFARNLRLVKQLARQALQPPPRALVLPTSSGNPQQSFEQTKVLAQSIEGMMSLFSMQVMDAVLTHQRQFGLKGHLAEFGVYKGRSAAVISAHRLAGERFVLVDIERYITDETVSSLFSTPEFWLGGSEDFARRYPDFAVLKGSVRFMHVDSSHSYRATFAEMKLADQLLSEGGVVCLDDFTNLNYSQILPALYKYLYTTNTDLTVFLVTDEKAYLCRRPWLEQYGTFVLKYLVDEMGQRGNPAVTIARTDWDDEYRAFYLRPRAEGETDKYGETIYGRYYENV